MGNRNFKALLNARNEHHYAGRCPWGCSNCSARKGNAKKEASKARRKLDKFLLQEQG